MEIELAQKVITAYIETLCRALEIAMLRASEACVAIQGGEGNQAIGALTGLDTFLEDALALYRATLASTG